MLIKARFYFPEVLFGFLLAVAIFAMGAMFWSSSHPPSAEQSAATQQQSDKKSSNDGKEAQSLWVPTDSVGLYTLVLCVFTGILAGVSIFQGAMLLKADKTARIAANAADLSARAAVAIELPVFRAEPDQFGFGSTRIGNGPQIENCIAGLLKFVNLGRTQAVPIEVHHGWTFGQSLPDVPVYPFVTQFDVDAVIKENGTGFVNLRDEFEFPQGTAPYDEIRSERSRLWFYCSLVYLDFMQTRHEAAFCWRRIQGVGQGRFISEASPAYNRKT